MLRVVAIECSAWRSQTYVVVCEQTKACLVIDPGDPDNSSLYRAFRKWQIAQCDYILLTHEHFDHIGGAGGLREATGARLVASKACALACRDARKNMSWYLDGKGFTLDSVDWICDVQGWTIPWRGNVIQILPCLGHSPGSVSIVVDRFLFSGDTLLPNGPGPSHLPGGDKVLLATSVSEFRRKTPDDWIICPGHGYQFQLQDYPLLG